MKVLRAIREHLPRRRRRFWRYVSPHRRGAGLLLLALLVTLVYGYWYMTYPGRVRELAQSYLSQLVGGTARVDKAVFRVFGGIELDGVRVYLPGDDQGAAKPVFEAKQVVLHHNPEALAFSGRLDVTRIACSGGRLRLTWDQQTQRLDLLGALEARPKPKSDWGDVPFAPPEVVVWGAEVELYNRKGGRQTHRGTIQVNVSAMPLESDPNEYVVRLESPGAQQIAERQGRDANALARRSEPIFGELRVNLQTGSVVSRTGLSKSGKASVDLAQLGLAPVPRWTWFKDRYRIQGLVGAEGQWSQQSHQGELTVRLKDISLVLPPEQGGLHVDGVTGQIVLRRDGFVIEKLTGRLPQFGRGAFHMNGEYHGYDANSPFDATLEMNDGEVPQAQAASGPLRKVLEHVQDAYQPTGLWDVTARVWREPNRPVQLTVRAEANDVSLVARPFPYAIDGLGGQLTYANDVLELKGLQGRHGQGALTINGTIRNLSKPSAETRLRIDAENIALDKDLRAALPGRFAKVFDAFDPNGQASAEVRVHRVGRRSPMRTEVDLLMDGRTSMAYQRFPLRLENLRGGVYITPERVDIRSVTSRFGRTVARINGTVIPTSKDVQSVLLQVDGNLPLDENLQRALAALGTGFYDAVNPDGMIENLDATVRFDKDRGLDYDVQADLAGVGVRLEAFDYPVEGLDGRIRIRPGQVTYQAAGGRNEQTRVASRGEVTFGDGRIGLDLHVNGRNVPLDANFLNAAPERLRPVWAELSPRGTADANFHLRLNRPDLGDPNTYNLTVWPRDVAVTWRRLPLPLKWVAGDIRIHEGLARFERLAIAGPGEMQIRLGGKLNLTGQTPEAAMNVQARHVPIDATVRGFLRQVGVPMIDRFGDGGQIGFDLASLNFGPARGGRFAADANAAADETPATRPAPAVAATSAPAGDANMPMHWDIRGRLAFSDANVQTPLGPRRLTGGLSGTFRRFGEGLAVDANIAVAELAFRGRKVTALQGKIGLEPGSTLLRVRDLDGRFHGGRLDGLAEIQLAEPLRYTIRLTADGVSLRQLYNAGIEDPNQQLEMPGKLKGVVTLVGSEGKTPSRRADGILHITKARFVRIPVLLGLVNVMYLSLPKAWVFGEGYVTYHLLDDRLVFEEIHLVGDAVSLVGSGEMDLKRNQLDVTFLAGPPGRMIRLSRLTEDFLSAVLAELVVWRVHGPINRPRMEAVPLRSVDAVLGALQSPGK